MWEAESAKINPHHPPLQAGVEGHPGFLIGTLLPKSEGRESRSISLPDE